MEIKVEGIRYGNKVILRPQVLKIESGMNCLIGPSGSGKTTLLKSILRNIRTDVSYLPQELAVPPYVTPKKMALYIAMRNRCSSRTTYLARFEAYVSILNLKSLLEKPFGTLSAGEKERVMIAVTLARGCHLYLADEPEKFLDPKNLDLVMALIKREADTSIVAVHNPLAFSFCDKFYGIFNGVIRETTPLETLGIAFKEVRGCKVICPPNFETKKNQS
ncbi:hypothetical protein EYM_07280 [Ignicoccus islandicus DSM 13165]|uniref:ABC transporter domain-containing protein n=1 Tax=Ignicoccus islandicus DSM 13165 TaxID=940295 RepID=A0A0U3E4B8_9CREN|nr:ABC transporter ATP-binding protein [Ignicoccus islandicus]ALU12763.1 hypothetical protein EYM_07280 [Ignicoccus islandicus DSM 13165]